MWKYVIVHHPAYFWPFLKAAAEKLMPHSQISFKSWLNNVGSKLHFMLWKSTVWWLEKVSFQNVWASPEPWTKVIVWQEAHFRPFLKVPEKNLMPHSQISFKTLLTNIDSKLNSIFSTTKRAMATWKNNCKKNTTCKTHFSFTLL